MLDGEVVRRKPAERSHRKVVGAAVVDGKHFSKVVQREKAVAGIEAFLILAVAAFDLAVVAWSIGAYELVADTELSSRILKQSRNIPFGVGKAIGELKAVVGLDTLNVNSPACIPFHQPF